MKQLTLVIIFNLLSILTFSQRGIVTSESGAKLTPDPSAIIDGEATTKGILIPRIALSAKNVSAPVVSPAHSLLIFNTDAAGVGVNAVDTGYYYWDTVVNEWVKLLTSQDGFLLQDSSQWLYTGSYIYARKAKDANQDVVVTNTGRFGIGTISPTDKIHVDDTLVNFGLTLRQRGTDADGLQKSLAINMQNDSVQWLQYVADPDGYAGVRANSYEIWEYPVNASVATCCRTRFVIQGSRASATNSPTTVIIDSVGNLGVGIVNPEEKLVVNGVGRFRGEPTSDDPDQRIHLEIGTNVIGNASNQVGPDRHFRILTEQSIIGVADDWLVFDALDGNNVNQDGGFIFREHSGFGDFTDILTLASGQQGVGIYTNTPVGKFQIVADDDATEDSTLVFTDGGALGIGTNNPTVGIVEVHQQNDNSNGGVSVLNSAGTLGLRLWADAINQGRVDASAAGNGNLILNSNGLGNVGIGTSNPTEKLEIQGGGIQLNDTAGIGFRGEIPRNAPVTADQARIYYKNDFPNGSNDALIIEKTDGNQPNPDGGVYFINTGNDNIKQTALAIRGSGNVGVGTNTPSIKLQVGDLADTNDLTNDGLFITDPDGPIIRMRVAGTNEYYVEVPDSLTSNRMYFKRTNLTTIPTLALVNDNVGIGIFDPTQALDVNGNIRASGNFISGATTLTVPDYVFEKYYKGESKLKEDYRFKSLDEIENFTKQNGHLPGIPSAQEIKETDEFNVTQSSLNNLEKIEELYLHIIQLNKEKKALELKLDSETNRNDRLESAVEELIKEVQLLKEKSN